MARSIPRPMAPMQYPRLRSIRATTHWSHRVHSFPPRRHIGADLDLRLKGKCLVLHFIGRRLAVVDQENGHVRVPGGSPASRAADSTGRTSSATFRRLL